MQQEVRASNARNGNLYYQHRKYSESINAAAIKSIEIYQFLTHKSITLLVYLA